MPSNRKRSLRKSKAVVEAEALEEATLAQVKSILDGIVQDHPHLQAARGVIQEEAPQSKFSSEFLQGFKTRLRS
jgi:hypothetical protein